MERSKSEARNRLGVLGAILAFFFVSGASGLLYQVVWTRKLVLLFGTTSFAVSTVLSIFFVGLGAGSLLGGRLADNPRGRSPLFFYGLFEVLIGAWALLFIFGIDGTEAAVVGLLRGVAASRGASIALRGLLSGGFLLAPVVLMGATLPLLAKFVTAGSASSQNRRGRLIGALYSVNTFGAVAGCAVTGFFILPELGYTRTTLAGAAGNGAIGLLAMLMSLRRRAAATAEQSPQAELGQPGGDVPDLAAFVVIGVFALSGFCALALEVLWTRLLAIIFLGTTYAFTTMLTTLLCGIALGSGFSAAVAVKRRHPVSVLGLIEIVFGLSCILMLPMFADLPRRLEEMRLNSGYDWAGMTRATFLLSFMVIFVPTFLSGMTFPVVVKTLAGRQVRLGRDVGLLYSANTFGGVVGAIAGGYLIIPLLGVHAGVITLGLILVAAGLVLVGVCPTRGRWDKIAIGCTTAAMMGVALWRAPADVSLALNDAYIPKNHQVVYYREGVEGTIAVSEPKEAPGRDRILWINAVQATAAIEKGVKMNRFEGVLPLLFDRDPTEVLFMCFGSGITAGTLGLYPFDRIDAVEIARDVYGAAPLFAADNFNVIANPRVNKIVDDGRNFLLTTANRYDVITFEPMPLALAGVSTFYTREYYKLCLGHLKPGGLVSQWIPLHSLNADVVRSLMATFIDVFPEYNAWFVNADLFMVGSNQPLQIDYARANKRLADPTISAALEQVGFIDLAEVFSSYFMGKKNIEEFAKGAPIMTDDRPWAEFIAPKLVYERTVDQSLAVLTPLLESQSTILRLDSLPEAEAAAFVNGVDRRYAARKNTLKGLALYYGGGFGSAPEADFKAALDVDPNDQSARYYLKEITTARVTTYLGWDEQEKAIKALAEAIKYIPEDPDFHLQLANILYDRNEMDKARLAYLSYRAMGGNDQTALDRLSQLSVAETGNAPSPN
ncbi:MAG: fused MFS/spermidine synthase [Candidatus Hydrogenedentes bacterium]|nr:fused MFS/spermidine synthase [Candidatus Hydrogenedentota bacterium]